MTDQDLSQTAHQVRRVVLEMCRSRGQGYVGQGLGLADIMTHLYFRAMRREGAGGEFKDRLVLSTGHSAIAVFATLGVLGLYELEELRTYGAPGSRIEESPLEGIPGFEITGGSLGQGLSQAIGIALGERMGGRDTTVFAVVSDGELQEGQIWEAAMSAGHYGLGNLVVLVDHNDMQADGDTATILGVEPIRGKFEAFGWRTTALDGHDHVALANSLPVGGTNRDAPLALICRTIPGKGVPSLETRHRVHYVRGDKALWQQATQELEDTPSLSTCAGV